MNSLRAIDNVAVVVLSWGQMGVTSKCFESINTTGTFADIFWVQNERHKEEAHRIKIEEYLRSRDGDFGHDIIRNEDNLGFPKGVNQALKKILSTDQYKFVVLLNNDTILPENWLYRMLVGYDPEYGAIGTLVDIGGFQRVSYMSGKYPELVPNMRVGENVFEYDNRLSSRQLNPSKSSLIDVSELAFFCTLIPVNTIKEVGFLDEAFGMGYGEDNDYCIRLKRAGYKLGVNRNIAIHHDHGGTSKLSPQKRTEVGLRATKILRDKWG